MNSKLIVSPSKVKLQKLHEYQQMNEMELDHTIVNINQQLQTLEQKYADFVNNCTDVMKETRIQSCPITPSQSDDFSKYRQIQDTQRVLEDDLDYVKNLKNDQGLKQANPNTITNVIANAQAQLLHIGPNDTHYRQQVSQIFSRMSAQLLTNLGTAGERVVHTTDLRRLQQENNQLKQTICDMKELIRNNQLQSTDHARTYREKIEEYTDRARTYHEHPDEEDNMSRISAQEKEIAKLRQRIAQLTSETIAKDGELIQGHETYRQLQSSSQEQIQKLSNQLSQVNHLTIVSPRYSNLPTPISRLSNTTPNSRTNSQVPDAGSIWMNEVEQLRRNLSHVSNERDFLAQQLAAPAETQQISLLINLATEYVQNSAPNDKMGYVALQRLQEAFGQGTGTPLSTRKTPRRAAQEHNLPLSSSRSRTYHISDQQESNLAQVATLQESLADAERKLGSMIDQKEKATDYNKEIEQDLAVAKDKVSRLKKKVIHVKQTWVSVKKQNLELQIDLRKIRIEQPKVNYEQLYTEVESIIERRGVDLSTNFRRIERKQGLMESYVQKTTEQVKGKIKLVRSHLADQTQLNNVIQAQDLIIEELQAQLEKPSQLVEEIANESSRQVEISNVVRCTTIDMFVQTDMLDVTMQEDQLREAKLQLSEASNRSQVLQEQLSKAQSELIKVTKDFMRAQNALVEVRATLDDQNDQRKGDTKEYIQLQLEFDNLRSQKIQVEDELEKANLEKTMLERKLSEVDQVLQETKNDQEDLDKLHMEELSETLKIFENKLAEANSNNEIKNDQLFALEQDRNKLKQQLLDEQMQIKDMTFNQQDSSDKMSALQDSLDKAQNNIKLLKDKVVSLAKEKEILSSREIEIKKDLDDAKLKLMTEMQDHSQKTSTSLEQLRAQLASSLKSNDKLKSELQKQDEFKLSYYQEYQQSIKSLEKDLQDAKVMISNLSLELNTLMQEKIDMVNSAEEHQHLKAKVAHLEEQNNTAQEILSIKDDVTKGLKDELEATKAYLEQSKKELVNLSIKDDVTKGLKDELEVTKAYLEQSKKELQDLSIKDDVTKGLKDELEATKAYLEQSKKQLQDLDDTCVDREEKFALATLQLEDFKEKYEDASSEIENLQEQVIVINEHRNRIVQQCNEMQEERDKANEKNLQLEEQLRSTTGSMDSYKEESTRLSDQLQELAKSKSDDLGDQIANLNDQLSDAHKVNSKLANELASAKDECIRIQNAHTNVHQASKLVQDDYAQRLEKSESVCAKYAKKIEKVESACTDYASKLSQKESQLKQLEQIYELSEKQIQILNDQQSEYLIEGEKQRNELQNLSQENTQAKTTIKTLQQALIDVNKGVVNAKSEIDQQLRDVSSPTDSISAEVNTLQGVIRALKDELTLTKTQKDRLNNDLEGYKLNYWSLEEELKKIKLFSNQSLDEVEKSLNQFAEANNQLSERLETLEEEDEDVVATTEQSPNLSGRQETGNEVHDLDIPNMSGFLAYNDSFSFQNILETDQTPIPTKFKFCRKAAYEYVVWCLIDPENGDMGWWKEDDLLDAGCYLPDDDSEETLLRKIYKLMKLEVGDNILTAISALMTITEESKSCSDKPSGSENRTINTESIYKYTKQIKEMKEEIYDNETTIQLLQKQLQLLKTEQIEASDRLSQVTGDKDSNIDIIRDIFVKFVLTVPVGKHETENLLRILVEMMNLTKTQVDEIQAGRAKLPQTAKKSGLFGIFGNK